VINTNYYIAIIEIFYLLTLIYPLIKFIQTFMQMLNAVTSNIKLEEFGDSTLALEQVYDFLYLFTMMNSIILIDIFSRFISIFFLCSSLTDNYFNRHYVRPIIINYALSEVITLKLPVQSRLIGYRDVI